MNSIKVLINEWKELDKKVENDNDNIKKRMESIEVELAIKGYCPQKLAHIKPIPKDKKEKNIIF